MDKVASLSSVMETESKDSSEGNNTTIISEIDSKNNSLSRCDAFINLFKCFCGSSLFTLPGAFAQSGLLNGCVSTIILGFLTYFTLCWLGECSHLVCTCPSRYVLAIVYMFFIYIHSIPTRLNRLILN